MYSLFVWYIVFFTLQNRRLNSNLKKIFENIVHAKYDFFYSSIFLNKFVKGGKRIIIEKIYYGLIISMKVPLYRKDEIF